MITVLILVAGASRIDARPVPVGACRFFQENDAMDGASKTLRAIAGRAARCAAWVLMTTLFGFGAQAQLAPGSNVRPALSREALARAQPTTAAPEKQRPAIGNPLWEISLSSLHETRARPLFSPSRRPPAPPVVAAPSPPHQPKPPTPREPDVLKLTLLGTVIGATDGIGIFVDETSKDVIRIRTGESHAGWTLRAVHRRSANFAKDQQETNLMLPAPVAAPRALSADGAPAKMGVASVCGNARGVEGSPPNCAPPAAPIVPVSAPTTRSAHKIRQDILSIGSSN